MIHYVSPRLREEGKLGVEEVINRLAVLIRQLRTARRTDAVEFQRQLEAEEKKNQVLADELESAKQTMLKQEAMLAFYRRKHGGD